MSIIKSSNYMLGILRKHSFIKKFLTNKCNLSSLHSNFVQSLKILNNNKVDVALLNRYMFCTTSKDTDNNILLEVNNLPLNEREEFMRNSWMEIINNKAVNENLFTEYLKLCLDNEIDINFIEISITDHIFSKEIFSLMLECVCDKGNIKQAVKILEAMKAKKFPVDEGVFNSLMLGQVIAGGLEGADSILATMKSAQIPVNFDTHWAIIKGLSKRSNQQEFFNCLKNAPSLVYNEKKFFDVLLILGLNDNYLWVEEFMKLFAITAIPPQSLKSLDNMCLYLIKQSKAEAAIHFYNTLAVKYQREKYAENLLIEMVHNNIPIEKIIEISSNLISKNLNDRAFYCATEQMLSKGHVKEALLLFEHLDFLRPHFFWPLIIIKGESEKEKGVMEILAKMKDFQVKPDFDTFVFYILKYCDFNNVFDLIERIRMVHDLVLKDLCTPIGAYLLANNNIKDAKELFEKYDVVVSGEKLITPLASIWKRQASNVNCVKILQKICESNSIAVDWSGMFLLKTLKFSKNNIDFDKYLELVMEVHNNKLTISPFYNDYISDFLKYRLKDSKIKDRIQVELDLLLDTSKIDSGQIKHPRNMNLEELECQLTEQLNKNMEVRGVLRILIQECSKIGDCERLDKLRELLRDRNYKESAGMKSSILHCYLQMERLEETKELFNELSLNYPEFSLDSYKIIDYATLLVKNEKFDDAINVLKHKNIKLRDKKSILRNCLNLLLASKNAEQIEILFKILVEIGYCDVNNVILGPLVKIHINRGDLKTATTKFCEIAHNYNRTPMQLELLMKLLVHKDEDSLQKVLNGISLVHGELGAKMSFIFALAEQGLEKPLEKFLIEINAINLNHLNKRCMRWAMEDKLLPIMTIIKASSRIKCDMDLPNVYLAAMKLFSMRNDCEGALTLWKQAESMEVNSEVIKKELLYLLKRSNHEDVKLINN